MMDRPTFAVFSGSAITMTLFASMLFTQRAYAAEIGMAIDLTNTGMRPADTAGPGGLDDPNWTVGGVPAKQVDPPVPSPGPPAAMPYEDIPNLAPLKKSRQISTVASALSGGAGPTPFEQPLLFPPIGTRQPSKSRENGQLMMEEPISK